MSENKREIRKRDGIETTKKGEECEAITARFVGGKASLLLQYYILPMP
jgi:hypothetical protein